MLLGILVGLGLAGSAEPARAEAPRCAPPVVEVRREARRHADLDRTPRWRKRARLAALLPWVSVRGARALDWDDEVYAERPLEVGNNLVLEARLSWRLDRVAYDPAEPRLADAERDLARARGALDAEVTTLYYRWRRAEAAAAEATDDEGAALAGKQLDAEEAWSLLDARTGGWLARQACRP